MAKAWIEKRYKDSYTIVVDEGIDPATNKRKRWAKSIKTDDPEEAEREKNIILGQVESNTYVHPTKMTVKEYFEHWLTTIPAKKLASTTRRHYKQCIELRIVPWIGHIKLSDLSRTHLNNFYERILKDGSLKVYSNKEKEKPVYRKVGIDTVIYHHRVIHRVLEDAIKDEKIQKNPADYVDLPDPEEEFDEDEDLVRVFSEKEIQTLLEQAVNAHIKYYALIYTALHTGLRREELHALSWDVIDFNESTIFVKKALVKTKEKGYEFKELKSPKRGKSKKRRKIEVTEGVLNVFRQIKEYQDKIIQKLEEKEEGLSKKVYDVEKRNLVFCRDDGQPMHPDTITSWFPDFCEEIKITRLTFHCLRHTHASHLLAAGEDISYVSKRLGHSSITMTYNTYFHFIPQERRESLKELEKKFKK